MFPIRLSDGGTDLGAANGIGQVVDASADHRRPAVSDAFGDEFVDERELLVGEPSGYWGCHIGQYTKRIAAWEGRCRPILIAPSRFPKRPGAVLLVCPAGFVMC